LTPGVTIPERRCGTLCEVRVYLRHRRNGWKAIALALTVAGGSLGLWIGLVSRLG